MHTRKRHACHKIRFHSNFRWFDFEMDPDRVTGVSTFLLGNSYCFAPEKATYPSQDPDAFEFAWPACHFFVGKFGWYCTRESGIPVTGSGCIRFHLDFEVQEKATRSSQDTDFASSWLSNLRILDILILKLTRIAWPACHFCVGKLGFYCTRKSDTPVTGSGCIRTLEIQKSDFACCLLLACCLLRASTFSRIWVGQIQFLIGKASEQK